MRLQSKIAAILCCAVGAMTLMMAQPAAAQNRATDWMVDWIARDAGTSRSEVLRRAGIAVADDVEIVPGVFVSYGAFQMSDGDRDRTLMALIVFNETGSQLCMRAAVDYNTAALPGARETNNNTGINFLAEPGGSDVVMFHAADYLASLSDATPYAADFVLWEPAPPGTDRRCSSVAPAGLGESWEPSPLPTPGSITGVLVR